MSLLRLMMLARATEQRARTLMTREIDAAPAAPWHREPVGAGAVAALRPGDCVVAPGRYAAAHLRGDEVRSVGRKSCAADLVPTAVGVALAVDARATHTVVLTLLDAGGLASARCNDALAVARERRLPLVVVVEGPGPSAVLPELLPGATGERLGGGAVNALDPEEVLKAVGAAVERARGGGGPALVTCIAPSTSRGSPAAWRSGSAAVHRNGGIGDPIERYARRLLQLGLPRAEIDAVIRGARDEVMPWTP